MTYRKNILPKESFLLSSHGQVEFDEVIVLLTGRHADQKTTGKIEQLKEKFLKTRLFHTSDEELHSCLSLNSDFTLRHVDETFNLLFDKVTEADEESFRHA